MVVEFQGMADGWAARRADISWKAAGPNERRENEVVLIEADSCGDDPIIVRVPQIPISGCPIPAPRRPPQPPLVFLSCKACIPLANYDISSGFPACVTCRPHPIRGTWKRVLRLRDVTTGRRLTVGFPLAILFPSRNRERLRSRPAAKARKNALPTVANCSLAQRNG